MKLLGSTRRQITKDENGENVTHLEITEVVLVHCNIVNNDYIHLFLINHLSFISYCTQKFYIFKKI